MQPLAGSHVNGAAIHWIGFGSSRGTFGSRHPNAAFPHHLPHVAFACDYARPGEACSQGHPPHFFDKQTQQMKTTLNDQAAIAQRDFQPGSGGETTLQLRK